jgi:SAM-dependent methyltransferase
MAEDLRQVTIDTYNQSAQALSDYFKGIGAREKYIDIAFELADNHTAPSVLEIGCGDGRDAAAIVRRTPNYIGLDISEELIKLARDQIPGAAFEVADVAEFDFPLGVDIVFAFASLLHLNKSELQTVFAGISRALRPGGIFYISSKYSPEYTEEVKTDQYGRRLFYFYNAEIMSELAGQAFTTVKTWREVHGHTDWFELIMRKI